MKAQQYFFSSFGKDARPMLACVFALVFALPLIFFGAPAQAQSTGTIYGAQQAQRWQNVTTGVIVAVRDVLVETQYQDRAFGAATGGILSGAVMNHLTRNSSAADRNAAMLLAATVGAYGGNAVAGRMAATNARELIIETMDQQGRLNHFALVQPEPGPWLTVGQPVFVLSEGGRHRVIPNNTMPNAFGIQGQPQY